MSNQETTPRAVLDHLIESITPASRAQAHGAQDRLRARISPQDHLGNVETLAMRLAAARHSPRPQVARKVVVVCAADHDVAYPGIDLGENSPTIIGVRQIARGSAAMNTLARAVGATVVVVDCGVRGGDTHDLGASVVSFRPREPTQNITEGQAMTILDALAGIQTGVALLLSVADTLDVVALGHLGMGGEVSAAAIVAALTHTNATELGTADADPVARALAVNSVDATQPIECLALVGGGDIAVVCGVILAAASLNVPVVIDDCVTSAAALIAAKLNPNVGGYLIAAHNGRLPAHRLALQTLGLTPLFDLGLAHGEGTGATLALPLVDAAAALLADAR